jgi:OOP family OmpA-OmpF porin
MVSVLKKVALFVSVGVMFFGCAAPQMMSSFPAGSVDVSGVVQKPDNYVVVFDSSQTMWYPYDGQQKLDHARQFVTSMNHTMPASLDLTGAFRKFGDYIYYPYKPSVLLWGPAHHTTDALDGAVGMIRAATGMTPLSAALKDSDEELARMKGLTAMIVVSDGLATDDSPIESARALKARYGDNLCIYTVLIGDSVEGAATMQAIADAGGCGFFARASELTSGAAMGTWVRNVFFKDKPAPPVMAPAAPCADSDGDGVCNDADKCPGTPKGAKVDADGCWILDSVFFDTDKTFIRDAHFAMLSEVAMVLKLNPDLVMLLSGNADQRASDAYNMDLSKRRVESVKNYLVERGAPADQIKTEWFGERRPKASGMSEVSLQMNRRVDVTPSR